LKKIYKITLERIDVCEVEVEASNNIDAVVKARKHWHDNPDAAWAISEMATSVKMVEAMPEIPESSEVRREGINRDYPRFTP